MKPGRDASFWWGIALLALGVIWLLDATDVLRLGGAWVGLVFAAGGIAFAVLFARSDGNWWAAIPAGALIGLGGLIAFVEGTAAPDEYGASILMGAIGLGFAAVYLRARQHWWALIPMGVLLTLAVMIAFVPTGDEDRVLPAILFAGIALTFGLLALIPIDGRRMAWPWIPAAILAVFAGFFALDAVQLLETMEWLWPAGLVVVGLVLVWRNFASRSDPDHSRRNSTSEQIGR